MNQRKDRPPADWQEVHRIKDEDTGAVVKVVQDMSIKFPRFSIEVGQHIGRDDDYLGRRIPIFLDRRGDEIIHRHSNLHQSISRLIEEAVGWSLAQAQKLDAEFKQQRELDRMRRGEPRKEVMRQGKTERKRRNRERNREDAR